VVASWDRWIMQGYWVVERRLLTLDSLYICNRVVSRRLQLPFYLRVGLTIL
jgi:hypothetical protein